MTYQYIKNKLPKSLLHSARYVKDAIQRWPQDWEATMHPRRRDSIHRLEEMKDIHKGERCFIIGNGPSLKNTDLTKIRNEYTFGMNRIYMMFPELGFSTTYFVSINDFVIEQTAEDIARLKIPKFLSWRSHQWVNSASDLFFLYTTYTGPKFEGNIKKRLWEGATVTYVALQIAYYMGFKQVILIGVDHSFATKGKANTTVISQGDDPNHFDPRYFGKGFRWQLPDLETSEIAYTMARHAFEKDKRTIIDATIGGKLQVFPKVQYDSLF